MGFKESKWVFKKPNGFGVIQMGPHGLHELHMGLGDPIWVHMGLLGARAVAAGLRTFFCPASFGLPDLAAAKPAASSTPTRARWGQELKITFQIREPGRKNKLLLVLEDIELNIFGGHGAEKGKEARHITKSSKDVGVVRCVGDIGQDWVGLGRGLCRSRREGNFILL